MSYKIRGNKLYVSGTVDGKFYRLATGKKATPLNIKWLAKNHRDVLLKLINMDRPKRTEMFVEYANQSMESNAYGIAKGTQVNYNYLLNNHIIPYFKYFKIDEIRASNVRSFIKKLLETMQAQSARNVINLLSKILDDARLDELIDKNPVRLVKLPRGGNTKDVNPFTMAEVMTLIHTATDWMSAYLTVAFFSGLRPGEMLALSWKNINFHSNKITVKSSMKRGEIGDTKTHRARVIDMLPPVHDALKNLFRKNGLKYGYIFTSRKGTPYADISSIDATYWKPLLKKCGMSDHVLYNTRHTFATQMLINGEDITWVSKMLGHANMQTTIRYYIKFVEEKETKRAVFLEDLFKKDCTVIAQLENKKQQPA